MRPITASSHTWSGGEQPRSTCMSGVLPLMRPTEKTLSDQSLRRPGREITALAVSFRETTPLSTAASLRLKRSWKPKEAT